MDLRPTFERLASLLRERLQAGSYTTEDSLRYCFCYALGSAAGVKHTDIILEHPHPGLPGAEIDTVILPSGERPSLAFEFKYDRANPGGKNQNRTQRAGAAFADIFRLAKIPSIAMEKYFIYATDTEMAGYFRNPANRLAKMFELGVERMPYGPSAFNGFSQTFLSSVATLCCDCYLSGVYSADFDTHCVRVWSVT